MDQASITAIEQWAATPNAIERSFMRVHRPDAVTVDEGRDRVRIRFDGIAISGRSFTLRIDLTLAGAVRKVVFEEAGTGAQHILEAGRGGARLQGARRFLAELLERDIETRQIARRWR